MSDHAGSSGESILNIQDSEDYPPSRSPSFSIVSELSVNDSVSVTSCMSHSHSISPVAKRKKNLHHPETTVDKFVIRTSRLQKEVIDEKIARFVYATNSPFHTIENPHFINMVQSLRPGYSPPNRADVAGKLLDKVYEREIEQCAKGLEGEIVNLSLDGWSNVHNDPVVCACVTTEEGNVFLTETIDTSGNAHTAEYLQEVVGKAITNCENKFKCLVRSLVTDNVANVSKMRRNLEEREESPKLITYGCSAHLMHLLAKDFGVPEIKANVVEIAKYFRNNHFASAALKKVGGTKLTLPQDVRWNSVVDCFEHYIKNWPNLMTVCEQNSEKIDGTVTAKVLNIGLKRNVEHMLSTLKPISVALNKMQGNSCFIADAVEIWKELSESLKREICNDRVKLQALKKRMGQALSPAHFLTNILNTQYQGQTLTAEEEELAMTWTSSNHPSIMPTIINFRAKGEPFKKYMFADDVLKKVTPVNWWKSLKHLDSETVEVIISLLTAVASSAGVERIFSSFGLSHSKLSNHLGPEKAGKLVFLFQIMNKQEKEAEDD
ncbi:dnaJ homolog subfamily C member 9 isoform X1 [Malaclemys terrapin pileata]|uniref:dnaJ homolog subfamily C member 9 isoform X1 n=1 Tax=Malaclemys terrapin pileata TaxID=2991368 RepID=UPI0023A7E250|nr:dnaJ homolog subfamily C member 9 isoform X1 [Malaclemys terrapin pileata]